MEEPYHTDAYNLPLATPGRFLDLTYRNSLPNLQPTVEQEEGDFDTLKVASRGTLQRRLRGSRAELELDCRQQEMDQDQSRHSECTKNAYC